MQRLLRAAATATAFAIIAVQELFVNGGMLVLHALERALVN